MKNNPLLLILIPCFFGCTDDVSNNANDSQYNSPDSLTMIQEKIKAEDSLLDGLELKVSEILRNRMISMSPRDSSSIGTDWSDSVEVIIVHETRFGQHPKVDVTLSSEYVLIGGGADILEQMIPGALLTASYPDNNLSTWHAESKDHIFKFYHHLMGYAIGLKLKGLTRDDLLKHIKIYSKTSGSIQHPNTSVGVGDDYILIGGGAKVNWDINLNSKGSLLVKSYPDQNMKVWYAEGKDHFLSNPSTITVYAIGIKKVIPNFGSLEISQESSSDAIQTGFDMVTVMIGDDWVVSCPGGKAEYAENDPDGFGRMLCGIVPSSETVIVTSKDHMVQDDGETRAYAIKIRKKRGSGNSSGSGYPGN